MESTKSLEASLQDLIRRAVEVCFQRSESSAAPDGQDQLKVVLELPRDRSHGDLATSIGLHLASKLKKNPLEVARTIAERINRLLASSPLADSVAQVEAKPPGFVNFFLKPVFLHRVLQEVLREGAAYGGSSMGGGSTAMVEFVSANPTGPLSVAHGRQAAVGDALANLLGFAGWKVTREYYLNDEGTQIDLLGKSVLERAKEKLGLPWAIPEGGYKGDYVAGTAEAFLRLKGDAGKDFVNREEAWLETRDFTVGDYTEKIRKELENFGVRFDVWTTQSSFTSGENKKILDGSIEELKKRGYLYEQEGAWWLKSTEFGDDKDRVMVRSDGRLTYIAPDVAYHRQKYQRGFALMINLWGPDHHGYIPRLKAAVQALGLDPSRLQIKIIQHATLKRGTETIPMSTREGRYITLQEVVDEVGLDAARFFFLLRKSDAHLEFDLELAKKHSLENPVYYIQYAHARICGILEKASAASRGRAEYSLLAAPEELAILRLLREFPGAVEACARSLEPFGMISSLQTLAEAFHRFYDVHRVMSDDTQLTAARLALVTGVRTVLGTGLKLLGVTAPATM